MKLGGLCVCVYVPFVSFPFPERIYVRTSA